MSKYLSFEIMKQKVQVFKNRKGMRSILALFEEILSNFKMKEPFTRNIYDGKTTKTKQKWKLN